MKALEAPGPYQDVDGNRIQCAKPLGANAQVVFYGNDNVLEVGEFADLDLVKIVFWCSHGFCRIRSGNLRGDVRIGEASSIVLGDNFTCTGPCYLSAAEGATIVAGQDCMLARGNEIRADDAHPIFDVKTGRRVNPSQSIRIGDHVWLADRSVVLAGSTIGNGSIIGFGAIVKGTIPNNCIAVGTPARVIKTNCAWERAHLSLTEPFYKPDADSIEKTEQYWNVTGK